MTDWRSHLADDDAAIERVLKDTSMPIEISGVRMAKDPLSATARGALIAALYEK